MVSPFFVAQNWANPASTIANIIENNRSTASTPMNEGNLLLSYGLFPTFDVFWMERFEWNITPFLLHFGCSHWKHFTHSLISSWWSCSDYKNQLSYMELVWIWQLWTLKKNSILHWNRHTNAKCNRQRSVHTIARATSKKRREEKNGIWMCVHSNKATIRFWFV